MTHKQKTRKKNAPPPKKKNVLFLVSKGRVIRRQNHLTPKTNAIKNLTQKFPSKNTNKKLKMRS